VWHLFRKSSCSSLAGRAASSTFCRGIRLIARGPERSIGSRRGSGIVSLIAATRTRRVTRWSSIARGGASCRVCKIFHPRCGLRVCGPSARIADTREKAFTAIPSDDEVWLSMAGRFSKSRCIHPGGRVRARKSARDSFICKQTVDVIRIYPLIPFIFYSRAARLRSAKADVRARLRLVLSADPSARAQPFRSSSLSLSLSRAHARLTSELSAESAKPQRFPIPTPSLQQLTVLKARAAALVLLLRSKSAAVDTCALSCGISRPYRLGPSRSKSCEQHPGLGYGANGGHALKGPARALHHPCGT